MFVFARRICAQRKKPVLLAKDRHVFADVTGIAQVNWKLPTRFTRTIQAKIRKRLNWPEPRRSRGVVQADIPLIDRLQDAGRIAPARDTRLSDRLRCNRRQMNTRERRQTDPGALTGSLIGCVQAFRPRWANYVQGWWARKEGTQ